jgi:hypothetical protein
MPLLIARPSSVTAKNLIISGNSVVSMLSDTQWTYAISQLSYRSLKTVYLLDWHSLESEEAVESSVDPVATKVEIKLCNNRIWTVRLYAPRAH